MQLSRRTLFSISGVLFLTSLVFAQWTPEWSSGAINESVISGWLSFQASGNEWTSRFYTLDSTNFRIMSSAYSQTPTYTYTFSAAEQAAGFNIYSLGLDMTGDGIVEFYVMSLYGTSAPYRQAFKVFDITNNSTVFERNDGMHSYGYPTVWDADSDGMLECTFVREDFPSSGSYVYDVFNTTVPSSARDGGSIPQQVDLKQNFPNPFNPSTRIEYSLAAPADVNIDILNVMGQHVKTLAHGTRTPGLHAAYWDGLDKSGQTATSGTYFYRLVTDGQPQATHKMMLIR